MCTHTKVTFFSSGKDVFSEREWFPPSPPFPKHCREGNGDLGLPYIEIRRLLGHVAEVLLA